MFTDQLPQSTSFIMQSGPALNISPVAPAFSSITSLPGKRPGWLLQASGTLDPTAKLYPGVLFAPGANGVAAGRPVLPNTGNAAMEFTDIPGADFIANANVRETDFIGIFFDAKGNKWKANGSLQRHISAATGKVGQIDVGNWTPVAGINAGPMIANMKHRVRIVYSWNMAALPEPTFTMVSYECNGVALAINVTEPMIASTWAAAGLGTVYLQDQLGLLPSGAPVPLVMRNKKLRYW